MVDERTDCAGAAVGWSGVGDPARVLPVSALNRLAREHLEDAFPLCWVGGEVSNLTLASSGHVYFSLKDARAQVRCVMFRSRAQFLGWRLTNGQHVEVRALVTLYEARGEFQLNIEAARLAGVGSLHEQFQRLKERLEREGLFAAAAKRPLPAFPRCVGIVTSPQAAALRDVVSTLRRRAEHVRIVLYPAAVQGDDAPQQIATAIRQAGERAECDTLIVCRGGGSIEDLWAFNDEGVARAIRACPLPVVCGIGHETDFTIADFAADRRAPTPTAAAELAVPDASALMAILTGHAHTLQRQMGRRVNAAGQQLDWLARRLLRPAQYLAHQRRCLLHLQQKLANGWLLASGSAGAGLLTATRRLWRARPDYRPLTSRLLPLETRLRAACARQQAEREGDLARLATSLTHLDPTAVLGRGYAVVASERGDLVRDAADLEPSQRIAVFFHRGRAEASVLAVFPGDAILPAKSATSRTAEDE